MTLSFGLTLKVHVWWIGLLKQVMLVLCMHYLFLFNSSRIKDTEKKEYLGL